MQSDQSERMAPEKWGPHHARVVWGGLAQTIQMAGEVVPKVKARPVEAGTQGERQFPNPVSVG